jgi:uncharacterized caspase-like protein
MWVRVVVAVFLLLLPSAASAQTEKRIALLIGNQGYDSQIGHLANPHNDIALLEKALKELGFEITTVRDMGLGGLHQAVNAYARRVQVAGSNVVGFFYYSGHGAADAGVNYLIPIDVKTTDTTELWDQSLRLTEITRKLKAEAGNATHFVVFDACRNTLKLTRAGSRALVQSKGFAPVAQESGMLIAYATAEGELASDVGPDAGPYARVLAEEIVKPGVEAVAMFRRVQVRVRATIAQEPWLGFSSLGEVYLAGVEPPRPASLSPAAQSLIEASREWSQLDKTSIIELETFMRRHGASPQADYAKALLSALKQQAEIAQQAANAAKKVDDEARMKVAVERQRLAVLQKQEEEKRRVETDAARQGAKKKADEETRGKPEASRQDPAIQQGAEVTKKRVVDNAWPPAVVSGQSMAGSLFNASDTDRLRQIAKKRGLVIPEFSFVQPADDVPIEARRFIGIWASNVGWGGGPGPPGRHAMLIVTTLDGPNRASGYYLWGPPKSHSFDQVPAGSAHFSGTITGGTLTFPRNGTFIARTVAENQMFIVHERSDGKGRPEIFLVPVWTLIEAERSVKK